MEFEDKQVGSVLVVRLFNNRLDAKEVDDFKKKMFEYLSKGKRSLVLDMSSVDFVDSSGLGALVAVYKSLGEGGRMAVFGIQDSVERMFKLTRMNKVFRLFPKEEEAVAALSA
jgi:anti-sigma B factor antagonist